MITSQLQDIQRSLSLHVNISFNTGNWRNENSRRTTKECCKKKEDQIGELSVSLPVVWDIYWIPTMCLTCERHRSIRHIPFFKKILPIWVTRHNYKTTKIFSKWLFNGLLHIIRECCTVHICWRIATYISTVEANLISFSAVCPKCIWPSCSPFFFYSSFFFPNNNLSILRWLL